MQTLAERVVAAVALQPMTLPELAKCLSTSEGVLRNVIGRVNVVAIGSTGGRWGRPLTVYGPVSICHAQKAGRVG